MKWLKKLLRMQWLAKRCEWMVRPSRKGLQRRLDLNARINSDLLLQLHESKQENERLTGLLTQTDIISTQVENGVLEMVSRPPYWAMRVMAKSFYDTLHDAPNWRSVEIGPMDHEGTLMIVTVRRASGQTPEETVGVLKDMIGDMLECVDPGEYPYAYNAAKDMLNPTQEK